MSYTYKCTHCQNDYRAQRNTSKFCSPECRVSHHRQQKAEAQLQRDIDATMQNKFSSLRYWIKEFVQYAEQNGRDEVLIGYLESLQDILHEEIAYQLPGCRD